MRDPVRTSDKRSVSLSERALHAPVGRRGSRPAGFEGRAGGALKDLVRRGDSSGVARVWRAAGCDGWRSEFEYFWKGEAGFGAFGRRVVLHPGRARLLAGG